MEPIRSGKFQSTAFPSTADIDSVARKRKGLFGLSFADWGRIIGALAVLYVLLGLLYYALLEAATAVRQEEWIELPSRFFGGFSKVERPLLGKNGEPALFKAKDLDPDVEIERTYNRADGCTFDRGTELLTCDRNNDEDGRWVVFPWVVDKASDLGLACTAGEKFTHTTLFGRDGVIFGEGDTVLDGVCVSSVPSPVPKAPTRRM